MEQRLKKQIKTDSGSETLDKNLKSEQKFCLETHFDKKYELYDERLQKVNDKDARGFNFISLNLFESE